MINISAIQEGFKNLVGFEQHTLDDLANISAELLKSESGLKVQKVHPLLSIENIWNCSKVTSANFNTYLTSKVSSSIANLINRIYAEKQLSDTGKELITEIRLFDGTGNFNDKVVKQDRFVGFRLNMKEDDLSIIMRMIGLQFDTINPTLDIYVYHTSQSEYVKKITINYDKPISFLWKQFDKLDLPFVKGGGYIIGYYESTIVGQAITREQIFSRMPACSTCNHLTYGYYQKWFKYLNIKPFYVAALNTNADKTKWAESSEVYVDGTNFGLNLSLSVVCDMSNLFIRTRELFSYALSLQIGVDLMEDIAFSMRDNQTQNKAAQMAMYALNDAENSQGLKTQLSKAIKALNFNTSNMNPICLPCNDNGQRIKIKSVF
jgi:hypothetical protein